MVIKSKIVQLFLKVKLPEYFEIRDALQDSAHHLELKVFSIVLMLINIVCFPLIIIGVIEAILLGQVITGLVYILLYSPVLTITIFSRKIQHKIKIFVILASFFVFAVHNMFVYAMSGASIPVFLVMVMLSIVFLNYRFAIILLVLSIACMIPVGYLFVSQRLSLKVEMQHIAMQAISWITAGGVLAFLGFLIIISYGIIKYKMLEFQIQIRNYSKELEELNNKLKVDIQQRILVEKELNEYKLNLERKVEERTARIKKQNEELEYYNQLFVGREFRIKELREKIKELNNEITNMK